MTVITPSSIRLKMMVAAAWLSGSSLYQIVSSCFYSLTESINAHTQLLPLGSYISVPPRNYRRTEQLTQIVLF